MEDTIELQLEAIDKQNQENQALKNYMLMIQQYNQSPTHRYQPIPQQL